MNYTLAKKLKDSGFEFEICNFPTCCKRRINFGSRIMGTAEPNHYHYPTLSELIEVCGEGIFGLIKQSEWHKHETGSNWIATLANPKKVKSLSLEEISKATNEAEGSTPEIAVAELWLKLNEQSDAK